MHHLPLAFALAALRRYREQRFCGAGRLALGGAMSVAGCFLIGCCGSPMLGVYLSLVGVRVLPLAKPIIAGLTTLLILGSYLWMRCRAPRLSAGGASSGCCEQAAPARDCCPGADDGHLSPARRPAQVTSAL